MYDREHKFFASALVVSLIACVSFAAALGLAPSQKAYAVDGTKASGYTEVQLLEYINTNIETMLTGFGMLGENTSQTHPGFRWFYTDMAQINNGIFQIRVNLDSLVDNVSYMFNRLTDIRAALVADTIEINGHVQTTVRNYARLAAENTDSMTTVLQAWNRDMGASLNGTASDATWFSTVSSRLLAMLNAINSANTNLVSIDSRLFEYFIVPQRFQQQDGSYLYTPAYYLQYLKYEYNRMQSYFLTDNQVSVDGTNYRTPHFYMDKIYDYVLNIDYYMPKIYSDTQLLSKLLSEEFVTLNGQTVYTPYYYLKNRPNTEQTIIDLLTRETITVNGQDRKTPIYYLNIIANNLSNFSYSNQSGSQNTAALYKVLSDTRDMINTMRENLSNYGYSNNTGQDNRVSVYKLIWDSRSVFYELREALLNLKNYTYTIRDYLYSNQASVATHLYNIWDTLQTIVDLMVTPDKDTTTQIIGDFDDEAYAQNMQQLRQQLGQVGVFSAVTSLGMIVYTISDADSLQSPSLDVPFEFAGSNHHLVIDFSWMDGLKPMINYSCMFLLFLQLTAWTIEAVKET